MHRADEIVVVKVPGEILAAPAERLDRNNRWDVSRHEGRDTIDVGEHVVEATLESMVLAPPPG